MRLVHRRGLVLLACIGMATCARPEPEVAGTGPGEGWLASVQARIAAQARAFHERDGAWVADARMVGVRVVIEDDAVRFRDEDGSTRFSLALATWGRADRMVDAAPAVPRVGACTADEDPTGACLRRVELERDGLVEWWVGLDDGAEQGFTLASPPAGAGPIAFEVAMEGVMDRRGGGDALAITDAAGRSWNVGRVQAWDARGEPLPAGVEPTPDGLRLWVDDAGATYPIEVDPAYTTAAWELDGFRYATFGSTVAIVGDVDGDGYADVVVGAPGISVGHAFIFRGQAAPDLVDATASVVLEGAHDTDPSEFGWAVAGAGDVNGDGYADVVVGEYAYGTGYDGRAHVFLGSSEGLASSAATTLSAPSTDAYFGWAVAGAGDVDADGYDDILVSAEGDSQVFLYRGSSAGVATAASTTLTGVMSTFGCSVEGAGDVDGDGYDDVIVGEYDYGTGGRALVYHGSSSGLSSTAATTLTGVAKEGRFGDSVASAGDVNDDGYDDVIVGAPYEGTYTGNAYVFHGSRAGISSTAASTLAGSATWDLLGDDVTGMGDADGDGYDDVAVGARGASDGSVLVYYGSAAGIGTTGATTFIDERGESSSYGQSLAAGDIDGDGWPDLIIGADSDTLSSYSTGNWLGVVYAYRGSASGLVTTSSTALPSVPENFYEAEVAGVGDLNADGYADIAVGDPAFDSDAGIVHVFLGGPDGPSDTPGGTLTGGTDDHLGEVLSAAGDVNGDGYGDLLVGGWGYASKTGHAYLYLGDASGVGVSPTTTLTGASSSSYFGYSLAAFGDADGDGYDDVLIGAAEAGGGGRVYLHRGSASGLASTATTTIGTDTSTSVRFGSSIAVGDFDADGYTDLAVGSSSYSSARGRVTVYPGGAGGVATTASVTMTGEASSNYFGYRAVAGDFNGDGYDDLAASSYGYDANRGRIYVFDGSSAGIITTASVSVTGVTSGDRLGKYLAAAGDLEGDGLDDLLVGSYPTTSSVDVYSGSAGGLETSPSSRLGLAPDAIAGAGDVDGDGYPDVVVSSEHQVTIYRGYSDADGDGSADPDDCDDADASIYPGATEACDGVDDDCDGTIDDGVETTYYADADADGFGDAATSTSACSAPAGWVADGTDCDDTRASVAPGAPEACDGFDDNCDGAIDEGVLTTFYADADGDGWGSSTSTSEACTLPPGHVALSGDCDDANSSTSPSGVEVCNGADDDCDGVADDDVPTSPWYHDADGDGLGDPSEKVESCGAPEDHVANGDDCDDTSAAVGDGYTFFADADADGYGDPAATIRACVAPDGYVADNTDCLPSDASAHPGAPEVWYDGVDEACNGGSDYDADGDGRDAEAHGGDDCDDQDAAVHPAAEEIWYDGTDQNCDGNDDDQDGDGTAAPEDCADEDPSTLTCTQDSGDPDGEPGADSGDEGGCGCGGTTGAAGWPWMAGMGLLFSYRRHARSRHYPRTSR